MFTIPAFSRYLAVTLLALIALPAIALAQRSEIEKDLGKSFLSFDIARFEGDSLSADGRVEINDGGKEYDLVLFPRDLRSRQYRSLDTGPEGLKPMERVPVDTYMGFVEGKGGSIVRLTLKEGSAEGYFDYSGQRYLIEPATRYSEKAVPGDLVVYKPGDHLDENGFVCESEFEGRIKKGADLALEAARNDLTGPGVIELATDADFEYVNALGGASAANSEILGILNMVEGTYQQEMNLSISVVFQHTWSAADPYDGTSGSTLLNSFKAYWNANFSANDFPRDTAHLFSAKPAVLSMGVAFLGTICRSPLSAYGFSGRVTWAPGKYLVTAHELGHNLNATHVDSSQGCGNTLMNAVLTNTTPMHFCDYSLNEMDTYVGGNGDCLAPPPASGAATEFDFDGDRKSDISVWRPGNGVWYIYKSIDSGFNIFQFGQSGDKPVPGDYDGDGMADAAVYRSGTWYELHSSDGSFSAFQFGVATDIPASADFDGDGKADKAVFRPQTGTWFISRSSDGGFQAVPFGLNGDVPVPADYDGDGKADVNLFRPSNGAWYRLNSSDGTFYAVQFGQSGDKPVKGDFDGDSKDDVAVFRPTTGTWYVLRSTNGSFFASSFGILSDIPTPGDFDGDGLTDIAVFRPSNGVWFKLNSSNGAFSAVSFGSADDVPAPASYLQ